MHHDPNPGPLPHRTYTELVGGPLDGLLLELYGVGGPRKSTTAWPCPPSCRGGPVAAALYDPRSGEPRTPGPGVSCRFYYSGDTP